MKRKIKILKDLGVLIFILFFLSCTKKTTPPELTTTSVTEVTYSSAKGGGIVTSEGGITVVSRGVCWSTTPHPTVANTMSIDGSGLGAFTSKITELKSYTTYYVRAYAINSAGIGYGNELTFTTIQAAIPDLTTQNISAISQISAVSGGSITSDNGSFVASRGVCWNTVANPTIAYYKTIDGNGIGTYISNLSGLQRGTTYFVRAYATNSAGTAYGNEVSFTTTNIPTLVTTGLSSISKTAAMSGGNIINDGGSPVLVRGICWSTTSNPTIELSTKTLDGAGNGPFASSISGLKENTTYYVRAYATTNIGTAYGNLLSFTTQFSDVDNNIYNAITIGSQVWMGENLKSTKFRNGDLIGTTTPATLDISSESNPKYQWAFNGDENNVLSLGRLYTYYTISDGRGVCPTGWHVPSDFEWTTLTNYLGEGNAGGMLKETGTVHWQSPNTGATNETGFTALPGGWRYVWGHFGGAQYWGGFLSSTTSTTNYDYVLARYMHSNYSNVQVTSIRKTDAYSVRCIKDN